MREQSLLIIPPKQFPFCIVWTPIPIISWLLPFVGHMGICTSKGITLDFAGPYFISVDNLAFGNPSRYIRLDPAKASGSASEFAGSRSLPGASVLAIQWDGALQAASEVYRQRMYNFLTDNCHCFVAHFLNSVAYGGSQNWNTIRVVILVLLRGRYVSWWGAAKTWLPFCTIMALGLAFGTWYFALAWACGLVLPLVLWFTIYFYACQKKALTPPSGA
ncbi:hypothetical protein WJX75_006285 [Coccomyxa subellipsoidea]|uniref:DUF778-domain-containing protein n=1 Tax=Coccomyxa subellipsoidea TaxID=248742 RepID=A0ABR2YYI0_9CHLO